MDGRLLNHQELVSIANKDEQYYCTWIADELHESIQRIIGTRRWISFRNAITVISRFGYFGLISTPGEEFCNAQVSDKGFWKHLLMIIFNNELQPPSEISHSYAKLIKDIHLITFFLFNDFYELAKRATNYNYLTSEPSSQSSRLTKLYRFLGCLSLAKLAIDIIKHPQVIISNSDSSLKLESEKSKCKELGMQDSKMICHLCSEERKESTSTLCGHIFCWYCIHNWLKERNECPICRTPTEPSRLIYLINFK